MRFGCAITWLLPTWPTLIDVSCSRTMLPEHIPHSDSRVIAPRWSALSLFGALGFGLSAVAHLATFAGVAVQESIPLMWALHVGIFPLFVPFVLGLRHWQAKTGRWQRSLRWQEILRYIPVWARVVAGGLFLYAGVNFVLAMSHLPQWGAGPPLDAREVAIYTMRAFSGHWLVFYAIPTIYFLFVPRDPAAAT